MISTYAVDGQGLHRTEIGCDEPLRDGAIWIDLLHPSPEEEGRVEGFLGIEVPTREEMREIETSNRLYEEDGTLYMTATVVTKLDTDHPENSQITFILSHDRLITNRYVDPLPFRRFISYAERHPVQCASGAAVLAGLLEALVNRIADVLERVGADLDATSGQIFTPVSRRHGRTAPPAPSGVWRVWRAPRAPKARRGRRGRRGRKAPRALKAPRTPSAPAPTTIRACAR